MELDEAKLIADNVITEVLRPLFKNLKAVMAAQLIEADRKGYERGQRDLQSKIDSEEKQAALARKQEESSCQS